MSKPSNPVRIDAELYAAASTAAPRMSRSVTQQISHWARIGKELEASRGVSTVEVARALAGESSYDTLDDRQQAVVRAHWAERVEELSGKLRFDREFAAERRPYVELDDDGRVVRRGATKAEREAG
jgi:hypothetical protein